MEFVYCCQTNKVVILYLGALHEFQRVGAHTSLQTTGCDNVMPRVALSFSLGFTPTCEHLEALNLIKASFFPSPHGAARL